MNAAFLTTVRYAHALHYGKGDLIPRLFCLTSLLLLLSFAFAQADQRALELLGATEPLDTQALNTLRMTMNITSFEPSGAVELRAKQHLVMDVAERRFYMEIYFDHELAFRYAYDQGEAFTQSFGLGDSEVRRVPEEQAKQLGDMLEAIQLDPTNLYPVDYDTATYDGVQRYAGLVEGEQVTVTVGVPAGMAGELGESIQTRLIFDGEENLVATVQVNPEGGLTLTTIGDFVEIEGHFAMSGLTFYALEGDESVLQSEMRFTNLTFSSSTTH